MIELRGIERVPPDQRGDARLLGNLTLWLSANLALPTVALGTLAWPVFGLSSRDALATILIFNLLGVLPVAFFATLGPRLGLRQMTISRFSFGWLGARLMAAFNVAACLGWSAVNAIVGGQLLAAVTGGPVWQAIVGLALLTTPICVYGYRYVHAYERVAWLPMAGLFTLLAWATRSEMSMVSGPPNLPGMLSFGGAVFGFSAGWSSFAADYNVNQREDAPSWAIFGLTCLGVWVPCVLMQTLGLALSTISPLRGLVGGELLAGAMVGLGEAGPPVLLLLALSVVATNIPNDYSLGLSLQLLGGRFAALPRHWWTLLGAVVYVALAITAAAHFAEALTDFLLIIGYWLGPWATIVTLEHVLRRGVYNVEDWNNPYRLPPSGPALLAMGMGLVGVALGASQALYVGPVARWLGKADVGFELAIALAAATYLLVRPAGCSHPHNPLPPAPELH